MIGISPTINESNRFLTNPIVQCIIFQKGRINKIRKKLRFPGNTSKVSIKFKNRQIFVHCRRYQIIEEKKKESSLNNIPTQIQAENINPYQFTRPCGGSKIHILFFSIDKKQHKIKYYENTNCTDRSWMIVQNISAFSNPMHLQWSFCMDLFLYFCSGV